MKKGFKKAGKILNYLALSLFLFHLGTQLNYTINDISNRINPSKKRTEFKNEFGYPIKGWKKDIEEDGSGLSQLVEVIHREKLERPFDLKSIRIRPHNYLKKSIFEQISQILPGENSGWYALDHIVLEKGFRFDNIAYHEIKHAKTFDILKENPNLLDEWSALSVDENNKSLYLKFYEKFCSHFKSLDDVVNKDKKVSEENERLGFVADYARTNVKEDIADLCEYAEANITEFLKWLDKGGKNYNPRIDAKVKLAQKYGLIPKEFSDYIDLKRIFNKNIVDSYIADKEKAVDFLNKSEQFLKENPGTIYEGDIRFSRGFVLSQISYFSFDKEKFVKKMNEAISEYKKGLNTEYKDRLIYSGILNNISECYSSLGDIKRANIYSRARGEYYDRNRSGDVLLAKNGINDYLALNGEL